VQAILPAKRIFTLQYQKYFAKDDEGVGENLLLMCWRNLSSLGGKYFSQSTFFPSQHPFNKEALSFFLPFSPFFSPGD
jgi:hypothetical protein